MSEPRERILAALRRLPDNPEFITVQALHREAISIVERELPESQWQPIETAPKDGSEFLSWSELSQWVTHWDEKSKIWKSGEGYGLKPTHWMPLPEPPEVSDEPRPN